jgi:hypothetical protein
MRLAMSVTLAGRAECWNGATRVRHDSYERRCGRRSRSFARVLPNKGRRRRHRHLCRPRKRRRRRQLGVTEAIRSKTSAKPSSIACGGEVFRHKDWSGGAISGSALPIWLQERRPPSKEGYSTRHPEFDRTARQILSEPSDVRSLLDRTMPSRHLRRLKGAAMSPQVLGRSGRLPMGRASRVQRR